MLKEKMVNLHTAHPKDSIKHTWHFFCIMHERKLGNHICFWVVGVLFIVFLSSSSSQNKGKPMDSKESEHRSLLCSFFSLLSANLPVSRGTINYSTVKSLSSFHFSPAFQVNLIHNERGCFYLIFIQRFMFCFIKRTKPSRECLTL